MLIIQKYFFFFLFLKPSPYNEKPTLSYIFTFSYKKFLRYIIISDIFWRISHFLNLFLTSYSVKPESWVHTKIKFSKNLPVTRLSIKYYGLKTIYKTQYLFFFFHLNLTSPWVTVKFHVISHLFRKKKKVICMYIVVSTQRACKPLGVLLINTTAGRDRPMLWDWRDLPELWLLLHT